MLINISLISLFLLQVYSYIRADWVPETSVWSSVTLLHKFAYSNKFMELIRFAILFLILIATIILSKHKKNQWIYIVILSGFVAIYTVEAVLDIGVSKAIYSGNLPLIYLLIAGFLVGQKKTVWEGVKKLFPIFMIAYAALFIYEFVDSYSKFGWVIYQNSSMMTYYAHMFWLSVAYIYVCITEGMRAFIVYPILIVLLIGAICLRSRSWVIQAVLLIIITAFTAPRREKKAGKATIKAIFVLVVIAAIAALLLNTYFGEFVKSLLEKGDADSRSFQYVEMLEQVEPYQWLFGQGMNATYTSKLYGEYTFIDNEIFYMSFHYGIFFAIIYFVPYLIALIGCFKHRKSMSFWLFSALVIFLWVASVNGLSVFNRIHLDIKSFIMPFLAGHIFQTAKDSRVLRSEK